MDEKEMIVAVVEQYDIPVAEFTEEDLKGRHPVQTIIKYALFSHRRYNPEQPTMVMRFSRLPGAWVRTYIDPYAVDNKIKSTLR